MNAKHTPTPWKVTINQIENPHIIADKDGQIANTSFSAHANKEANAKHIVKCVNMHDELVSTLEQVKSYLERISCNIPLENQDSNEIAELILETLENAKGE